MPLPIGHSLVGYVLYDTMPQRNTSFSWKMLIVFVILANLPDFDFLPGFLVGEPNLYHRHAWSHSLGSAVVVGALFALIYYLKERKHFGLFFLIFTGVYFSHVFLDYFSIDKSAPYGVPMFWPFTDTYYISPVGIFLSIQKSGDSSNFFQKLIVTPNLWAALREFIVFIPVLAIMKLIKKRREVIAIAMENKTV